MHKKIIKLSIIIYSILILVSCMNNIEDNSYIPDLSYSKSGDCYVAFNLSENNQRTVLPEYSFTNCFFDLFGTKEGQSEELLLQKVSYDELIRQQAIKVKAGRWTFTVDCYSEDKSTKILSGTSIEIDIADSSKIIQIPMTFITGNNGNVNIKLIFPNGSDIGTVTTVKADIFNSPIATATDNTPLLTINNGIDSSYVILTKNNLESGLTKYVKFFLYSETGVELAHYTEAVIIADNMTSIAERSITSLKSSKEITIKIKSDGEEYTGETKTLKLKAFPNEEKEYPLKLNSTSTNTYSATIITGMRYILYEVLPNNQEYNTKIIFTPRAEGVNFGIVEYCSSISGAEKAIEHDEYTSAGIGFIVSDSEVVWLNDYLSTNYNSKQYLRKFVQQRTDKVSFNLENCPKVTSFDYVFDTTQQLQSVSLPQNITYLGDGIRGCYSLVALYLNEGFKSSFTWYGCPTISLEYLYVPSTMIGVNWSEIGHCVKLKKIDIATANPDYQSSNGCIYSKDGKTLYSWPAASGDITIEEGIETIDSGTFHGNTRITNVTLPSTLKKIGTSVFSECSSIRMIDLPQGLTEIGKNAFYNCSKLKEIDIPMGCQKINDSAFAGCSSLKNVNISNSVEIIGPYAFQSCSSLKTIVIPEGITEIGYGTFAYCTNLTSVELPNSIKDLGIMDDSNIYSSEYEYYGVFRGCESLKQIVLPNGLERIGHAAFYKSCIDSISIPDSVTYIGKYAFAENSNLKSINFGMNVETIGASPLRECSKIEQVTVSETNNYYVAINNSIYTKDKKRLLYYFVSSNSVEIPNGVETIDPYACYHSKSFSILSLPKTLQTIGEYAFSGTSISEIQFTDNIELNEIGDWAFSGCNNLECVILPESVRTFGNGVFSNCSNLSEIYLNEGLQSVGVSTIARTKVKVLVIPGSMTSFFRGFEDCSIETVYIMEGVTQITSWGFWHDSKIKSIYLPKSLTSWSSGAFEGCNKITDIYYAGSNTDWSKVRRIGTTSDGSFLSATVHYDYSYTAPSNDSEDNSNDN